MFFMARAVAPMLPRVRGSNEYDSNRHWWPAGGKVRYSTAASKNLGQADFSQKSGTVT